MPIYDIIGIKIINKLKCSFFIIYISFFYYFAHLNNIYVNKGDRVEEGDLIGKTGKTGRVTGPHLHYEIRKNGKPLNPMQFKK